VTLAILDDDYSLLKTALEKSENHELPWFTTSAHFRLHFPHG